MNGGEKVKAVAAEALAGGDALVAAAVDGYDAGSLRDAVGQDRAQMVSTVHGWDARQAAWPAELAPYAKTYYGGKNLWHAPGFEQGLRNWLIRSDQPPELGAPAVPVAGQGAIDRANAIGDSLQGGQFDQWFHGSYFKAGASADDVRRFIELGGYPRTAPAPGSVEFRTQVEELKIRWAGCDMSAPLDQPTTPVLGAAIAQAKAEWQAELDAQAGARNNIAQDDIQATKDLATSSNAMIEAIGQAWVASGLLEWQRYWHVQNPKGNILYPKPALFTAAASDLARVQKKVAAQLAIANTAAASAKGRADAAAAAQNSAYQIADQTGVPRGRALGYAQQAVQVTRASAAAAQSAAATAATAVHATTATVADSMTLAALAEAQAHALQAAFQRAAAQAAADQAHAAARGAAAQAAQAAGAATRATADQATAQQDEATAEAAAQDADQRLATAQQQTQVAAAARATADQQHAQAAQAEATAQQQQGVADTANQAAQAAGTTSAQKAAAAAQAEVDASLARDQAVQAESDRDALQARAKATAAAAAAAAGTADAAGASSAATDAQNAADQASSAATSARSAANQSDEAAVAARAAATQAAGAAARARASAAGAVADARATSAAAQKAHAAAADAIAASTQAAQNVKNAQQLAATAAAAAVTAHQDAISARAQAVQAAAASAVAAGQAYAAAQASTAARDSAQAAVNAGSEAILLGTPFQQTDPSAGYAVLVGQTSQTLAQQQAAAAKANADEAAKAATAARAAAAKAGTDAKAAATSAATAATDAASAASSVTAAQTSAATAAAAADAAKQADENTAGYDAQASNDALNATAAANSASTDATAAGNSATAAEKDTAAAHTAATNAQIAATSAQTTATTANTNATAAEAANTNATAAEAAAANAQSSAQQANQAATTAESQERAAEQAANTALVNADTGNAGPVLTSEEEQILLARCGQDCVDQFRQVQATAGQSVLDWVKANGGQILLDVIGVTDAKKCFTDPDVESCLWTLVNVASLVAVVGKLPAVSKAIVGIAEGISKFFEEVKIARTVLNRLREVIEDAKNTVPCLDAALTGQALHATATRGAHPMAAAAPRAAVKRFCGIKWVSMVDQDWATKGAHINLKNGAEVRIYPDGSGGISGEAVTAASRLATQTEVDSTLAALRSDPALRAEMIAKTTEAMRIMNTPLSKGANWGMAVSRAAEMKFLIDALKRLG